MDLYDKKKFINDDVEHEAVTLMYIEELEKINKLMDIHECLYGHEKPLSILNSIEKVTS